MIREQSTKRNEYRLVRDTGKVKLQNQRKKKDYWRGRENILHVPPKWTWSFWRV